MTLSVTSLNLLISIEVKIVISFELPKYYLHTVHVILVCTLSIHFIDTYYLNFTVKSFSPTVSITCNNNADECRLINEWDWLLWFYASLS